MTTPATATVSLATATYLANRYYDWTESTAPKAKAVAEAALNGACGAIHSTGVGFTPSAVRMAVTDACRAAGPRPVGGAFPTERKAHGAAVAAAVAEAVAALD